MRDLRSGILSSCLSCLLLSHSFADETQSPGRQSPPAESAPARSQPWAGIQFWGDVQFWHNWHIQQNVFSKRYRLLDPNHHILATGTLEECREQLQTIRQQLNDPPPPAAAVVLLHGLGRSDKTVAQFQRYLANQGRYVVAVNYPSLRGDLETHAGYLKRVLQSLEGTTHIDLVGFSLGGLVVRTALAEDPDPRIKRVVLLGTPNQGAELAGMFRKWSIYRTLVGPAGQQLCPSPHGLAALLPAPPCEFGIIAGQSGSAEGFNPLVPGDDDGVVGLHATCLPGATDCLHVNAMHPQLLHRHEVFEATDRFLTHGYFRPDGTRQPHLALPPVNQVKPAGAAQPPATQR